MSDARDAAIGPRRAGEVSDAKIIQWIIRDVEGGRMVHVEGEHLKLVLDWLARDETPRPGWTFSMNIEGDSLWIKKRPAS